MSLPTLVDRTQRAEAVARVACSSLLVWRSVMVSIADSGGSSVPVGPRP